jgi:hypothetical protein
LRLLLTIVLTTFSICCIAQHNLTIGASTNGLGISYSHVLNKKIQVGGSLYYLQLEGNTQNVILENIVNSKYTTNTPLVEGFVQWKPFLRLKNKQGKTFDEVSTSKATHFKERFFVKTGLALRSNPNFKANSTFWDKTFIGNFELTPDQVGYVNINVKTNKIQPMVAIGYAFVDSKQFFMNAEIGTYFHGIPQVSMKATGTLHLNDINQAAIQKTASKYQYFPLLKLETGIKL